MCCTDMLNKYVNTLRIRFKNEIQFKEIVLFRGAVLNKIGEDVNVLFHNHVGVNDFRYSYPLIQYKRINKKAVICCLGEGVECIGEFFMSNGFRMRLGEREVEFEVEGVIPKRNLVQVWTSDFRYRLTNWLPLSGENYNRYKETESVVERVEMLEHILIGNIISFAKGVGVEIESEIICKITQLNDLRVMMYKGVKMLSFNVEFKSNVTLPEFIGLGKGVSVGFGVIRRIISKENIEE